MTEYVISWCLKIELLSVTCGSGNEIDLSKYINFVSSQAKLGAFDEADEPGRTKSERAAEEKHFLVG